MINACVVYHLFGGKDSEKRKFAGVYMVFSGNKEGMLFP